MSPFLPGQRWLSTTEPELGLGTILKAEGRNVVVLFATAAVTRQYAAGSAPLVRAAYKPGDRISVDGVARLVNTACSAIGPPAATSSRRVSTTCSRAARPATGSSPAGSIRRRYSTFAAKRSRSAPGPAPAPPTVCWRPASS
jgi:hypothetical protein